MGVSTGVLVVLHVIITGTTRVWCNSDDEDYFIESGSGSDTTSVGESEVNTHKPGTGGGRTLVYIVVGVSVLSLCVILTLTVLLVKLIRNRRGLQVSQDLPQQGMVIGSSYANPGLVTSTGDIKTKPAQSYLTPVHIDRVSKNPYVL